MSTEVVVLGYAIKKVVVFSFAGCFGGFFPCIHDLLQRQKLPKQNKIELSAEFFLVKAVLIPFIALVVTILAVTFETISTWLAALYLGASLPILIEKVVKSGADTVADLDKGQ